MSEPFSRNARTNQSPRSQGEPQMVLCEALGSEAGGQQTGVERVREASMQKLAVKRWCHENPDADPLEQWHEKGK